MINPEPLATPPGDPESLSAAANALGLSSQHVESARDAVGVTADMVQAGWMSEAATSYRGQLLQLWTAMAEIPDANKTVAKALLDYSDALTEAQATIKAQSRKLTDEIATHARVVAAAKAQEQSAEQVLASLDGSGGAGMNIRSELEQEIAQAKLTIANADQTLQQTDTACKAAAAKATKSLEQVALYAQEQVQHASGSLSGHFTAVMTDILAAGANVSTVFVTGLTSYETASLVKIARTLHNGTAEDIAALDEHAFEEAEKIAMAAGPNSARALAVWLEYESRLVPAQLAKIGHAIDGLDSLDEAETSVAQLTSVLGKLGFTAGIAADLATLMTDKDPTDRWLSAFNLAGSAEAAGEPIVRGLMSDLLGMNVDADAVPYVGEAVMLGTALALGGKFVVDNWSQIEKLAGSVKKTDEGAIGAGTLIPSL